MKSFFAISRSLASPLNALRSTLAVLVLLAFIPRVVFAQINFKTWLMPAANDWADYDTESVYIYNTARWSLSPSNALWFSGYVVDLGSVPTVRMFQYTRTANYYLPCGYWTNIAADNTVTQRYIPYSNNLSVVIAGLSGGALAPWQLSACPTEFTNATAYRTSFTNSFTLTRIPTGTYSATFTTLRGYAAPAATDIAVSATRLAFSTNTYIAYSNSLAVTVSGITSGSNAVWTLAGPAEFTNALSYGTTFTNAFTFADIPTGLYTVTFPAVVGYTAPAAASTNITGVSPLVNSMTGTYAGVIWGTNTSTNTPATNFPAYTNAVTLMVDTNGLFKTPSREKIIAANGLLTNGAVGPQGPAGSNGDTGAQGPQGISGPVTNQIMDVNGILYTITNAPPTAGKYVVGLNPANSTAWFAAESITTGTPLYLETYMGTITGITIVGSYFDEVTIDGPNASISWDSNSVSPSHWAQYPANGVVNLCNIIEETWTFGVNQSAPYMCRLNINGSNIYEAYPSSNVFKKPIFGDGSGLMGTVDVAARTATNAINIVANAALPKVGGTMTGALTNEVAIWLPSNGIVYFGSTNSYIQGQDGTNFLFTAGTNTAVFGW